MTIAPIPDDFAEVASKMTNHALCAHYRRARSTIAAWRESTGVTAPICAHPRKLAIPSDFATLAPKKTISQLLEHYRVTDTPLRRWIKETGIQPKPGQYLFGPKPVVGNSRDTSAAGRAAEHLQKWGPVYRASTLPADERNRLGATKSDYILYGRAISPIDLIAAAERRGFDPREWAAIPSQTADQSAAQNIGSST